MGFLKNVKVALGINKYEDIQPPNVKPTPKKILVVEDEIALAEAMEFKLKSENYNVFRAGNGSSGLKLLAEEKPDLLILDLLMPVMDGKTMLLNIRKMPEFKNLPIIILTNEGSIENIRDTQTLGGAVDFLIKSNVSMNEIVDKVKSYLPNF